MSNEVWERFTDEDLERWKGYTSGMPVPLHALAQVKALMRRLEAAEDAMSARGINAFRDKYEIWQKAAGKQIS